MGFRDRSVKSPSSGEFSLFEYVKHKVDLADFLETHIACTLKWHEHGVSAGCICPFLDHSEKKGSFNLRLTEDGVWLFHCFGCDRSGSIIDFCQVYYGLKTPRDALLHICKLLGLKDVDQAEMASYASTEKKFNVRKKMECSHIEVASQCRRLLKKDYKKYSRWVSSAYKRMNEALDKDDIDTISKIGFEACNKIGE